MGMQISDLRRYQQQNIMAASKNSQVKEKSDEQLEEDYFNSLKDRYPSLNLKKSSVSSHRSNSVTITLSPDLIKKAVKDKKVDKLIKKSLDEFNKNKKVIRNFNCSKDGKEVSGVNFFIDKKLNIKCDIKVKKGVNSAVNSSEDIRNISIALKRQEMYLANKAGFDKSLTYKYLHELNNHKFTSLDVTV